MFHKFLIDKKNLYFALLFVTLNICELVVCGWFFNDGCLKCYTDMN
jgi:hypothetical protein